MSGSYWISTSASAWIWMQFCILHSIAWDGVGIHRICSGIHFIQVYLVYFVIDLR
jgi:hypothetical protein